MYLSLLDLMRRQTGRFALEPTALPELHWREEGGELILRVALHGIDPRSLQVQVSESAIALAGHRSEEERVEGPDFYRASASFGLFSRTLPLPARVIPRESRLTWRESDVLEIRLRKA